MLLLSSDAELVQAAMLLAANVIGLLLSINLQLVSEKLISVPFRHSCGDV